MKKARLVQIIKEEISKVLKEGSMQAREIADRNSLQQLQSMYDQLMRDMEQEAEPEGGPIADQYADQMQDIEDAMQIKRGGSGEMTYGDMLHKNYPDKYGPGGVELDKDAFTKSSKFDRINEMAVNEMATFYKVKGDKAEAKKAIKQEKEKYREGTALYNTLDTLEKKGEIDYKELSKKTGKDVASYNNPKSRGVLEKDLADFIEAEKVKRGPKADPNKPKKEKKSKKDTTPKSKKKSTVSKLEKKYYVDAEDGGPTDKELRDLAKSGLGDESLSKLQSQERKKMLKAALKDLQKKGILDKSNKVLDREAYDKEFAKIKVDIANKVKNIK